MRFNLINDPGRSVMIPGKQAVVQMIPMQCLAAGEKAQIFQIDGQHDLVVRLQEMGLRRGTAVRMVQPGCPCIVAVNNHRVSFRGEDAAVVLVEPLS